MSCGCNGTTQNAINSACSGRKWWQSVFDDCFTGSISDGLMSGLMGELVGKPVHIGAPFELGVEIDNYILWPDDLDSIRRALDGSGYVQAGTQVYKIAGLVNPFVVIKGKSGREYGSDQHLRDAIISATSSAGYPLNLETVTFQVVTYDPETGQTQTTQYGAPVSSGSPNSGTDVFNTVAESLGMDRVTAQILTFGGIALAAVLILKR